MQKRQKNMVLRRYALVLCTLALAFTLVLGIARAKENSDRMRTGRSADVIDVARGAGAVRVKKQFIRNRDELLFICG